VSRTVSSNVQNEKLIVERRDRIIRAAITVFRRSGFHVATTKDIAREADLTQSNIYNYVSSKNDVLFLVCEHLVNMYHTAVTVAVAQHDNPRDQLIEALRAVVMIMSEYREEVQLLYNETHTLEKKDRKLILTTISKFIKTFQTLLINYEAKHGPCLVDNKRIAANFLSFVPAIVALRSWDLLTQAGREEVENTVLSFTLRGLGIPMDIADEVAKVPAISGEKKIAKAQVST
jgi:AcrR family transcriptional regulator